MTINRANGIISEGVGMSGIHSSIVNHSFTVFVLHRTYGTRIRCDMMTLALLNGGME